MTYGHKQDIYKDKYKFELYYCIVGGAPQLQAAIIDMSNGIYSFYMVFTCTPKKNVLLPCKHFLKISVSLHTQTEQLTILNFHF